MSVIIRLQNLPWSANALDIRQYFRGLSIPEGGVHIVGGELGDAFIAFSTDEDARQAFQLDGGKIKEVQIKLLLSSRTEMQKVIEAARNPTPFMQTVAPQPLTLPAQVSAQQIPTIILDGKSDSKMGRDDKLGDKRRGGRSRSRSRERRRDRSRDRSRDRKDRRRRDRSRSRERRDRHRRERSRSRNRSRTHDRSRSRERDNWRGKDKKRDTSVEKLINGGDISSTSTTNTDLTECNNSNPPTNLSAVNMWDTQSLGGKNTLNTMQLRQNLPSLMANFDQNRRSIGSIPTTGTDTKDHIPTNDYRSRDSWPPTQQFNDNRFLNQNLGQSNVGFRSDSDRPFNNRGRNMFDSNLYDSRANNLNQATANIRPLLGRPTSLSGAPFSPYEGSMDSTSSIGHNEHSNDSFHREGRDGRESRDGREGKPKVPRPACCVKVRIGRGGYGDVRRFFQGLFIANDGVKLVNDEEGRRTGVAYVRFVHPEGKIEALQRSGSHYRGNTVEVTHCEDGEFEKAIDSYVPPPHRDLKDDKPLDRASIYGENIIRNIDDKLSCIAILNLPPYTKEHDIITMVGDFPLVSVLMVMNKDSQQLGYLQFTKPEDALRFYNMKDKHFINGKGVTVQLVSENIFNEVKRQHNSGNGIVDIPDESKLSNNGPTLGSTFPVQNEVVSDCVVLKGLPFKTTDRDIIDFFSDIGLVPSRIHVPLGKSNKPSNCYCEFADSNQALQATTKNGTPLGMNEVLVEIIPRREMEQQIGLLPTTPDTGFSSNSANRPSQFNNGSSNIPNRRPLLGGPPNQRPAQNQTTTPQYVPEAFRNQGCVLSLENVPFRAGVNEILEFFRDFNIPEENVMRRYNDRGHPTGDARVAFSSPLEAQRAFSELRHCKIRDRTIFMHLV